MNQLSTRELSANLPQWFRDILTDRKLSVAQFAALCHVDRNKVDRFFDRVREDSYMNMAVGLGFSLDDLHKLIKSGEIRFILFDHQQKLGSVKAAAKAVRVSWSFYSSMMKGDNDGSALDDAVAIAKELKISIHDLYAQETLQEAS